MIGCEAHSLRNDCSLQELIQKEREAKRRQAIDAQLHIVFDPVLDAKRKAAAAAAELKKK